MAYTYVGAGTSNNPQAGDMWLNSDGSVNAYYTGTMWESGGALSAKQTQDAITAAAGLVKGSMPSPDNLQYESATVAYDATTGQYVNPQSGAIYGSTPPTGSWVAPADPAYSTYVTQALAAQPSTPTSTVSTNAAQTQPSGSVQAQSNTATAGSNAPIASDTTVNSGSLSNLLSEGTSWLSANPLLGLGALAVIVFMFMGSGGEGKHARH